jgi:hypothetical protein
MSAWLASKVPKRFGPQDDECCSRDDDAERGLCKIAPDRQARELAGEELQVVLDSRELGSRLIGLLRCNGYLCGICTLWPNVVVGALSLTRFT